MPTTEPGEAPARAVEVLASFRGVAIGVRVLWDGERRGRRRRGFVIGAAAGADAPVDARLVQGDAHHLVSAGAAGYVVNVGAAVLTGEVDLDGRPRPLGDVVAERGATFVLPAGASARLRCGD